MTNKDPESEYPVPTESTGDSTDAVVIDLTGTTRFPTDGDDGNPGDGTTSDGSEQIPLDNGSGSGNDDDLGI